MSGAVDLDQAATRAMRNAADRLKATPRELGDVLAALFATPHRIDPIAPSHVHRGEPMSPTEKDRVRELLIKGWDSTSIEAEVGCSVQAVNGIRATLAREKAGAGA